MWWCGGVGTHTDTNNTRHVTFNVFAVGLAHCTACNCHLMAVATTCVCVYVHNITLPLGCFCCYWKKIDKMLQLDYIEANRVRERECRDKMGAKTRPEAAISASYRRAYNYSEGGVKSESQETLLRFFFVGNGNTPTIRILFFFFFFWFNSNSIYTCVLVSDTGRGFMRKIG